MGVGPTLAISLPAFTARTGQLVGGGPGVLVVEEDAALCHRFTQALADDGCDVYGAGGASVAAGVLRVAAPALVPLEADAPAGEVWALLAQLRAPPAPAWSCASPSSPRSGSRVWRQPADPHRRRRTAGRAQARRRGERRACTMHARWSEAGPPPDVATPLRRERRRPDTRGEGGRTASRASAGMEDGPR